MNVEDWNTKSRGAKDNCREVQGGQKARTAKVSSN